MTLREAVDELDILPLLGYLSRQRKTIGIEMALSDAPSREDKAAQALLTEWCCQLVRLKQARETGSC